MSDHNRSQPLETDAAAGLIDHLSPSPLDSEHESALISPRKREKKKQLSAAKESNGPKSISQDFLQHVVQVLPARVAVLDARGKIVVVNQAWISYCNENGLSVKKFGAGGNYLQLCRKAQGFCRENGPKAAKGIESVIAGHQDSFYMEYACSFSNKQRWFQIRISRFYHNDKCWILINHENITEPKQTGMMRGQLRDDLKNRLEQNAIILNAVNTSLRQEIARRTVAEQTVSEERNRFRTLVETIPHGIMEFDLNDMVTFANAECHRILEYSEGSLIGKCLWDIAKASFPEVENCIEKTLREHPSPTVHFCSFRTPTDKSIDIQVDWNYERDPQGSVIGFVIVITDITQQRQAEEEARQHLDQLAHVSRMFTMNQMASGLAHELNQPLAAIANFAQACRYRISKSSIKDRNAILESIEQISVQADRAGQIIRRLRDFVRRADSSRSCENINDLVGDILSLLVTEARAHQIRLDSDLAADLPQVSVDRIQIEQVITNLVKNAMEASGDLAPALRCVTIRTEMNAEGMLDVSVTDTGKGIEVEELNQVFEPFYTTKQSGMGLGLSISRSIVEAHGGRLDAVRNAQTGMTFHFTLPIAADGGKA